MLLLSSESLCLVEASPACRIYLVLDFIIKRSKQVSIGIFTRKDVLSLMMWQHTISRRGCSVHSGSRKTPSVFHLNCEPNTSVTLPLLSFVMHKEHQGITSSNPNMVMGGFVDLFSGKHVCSIGTLAARVFPMAIHPYGRTRSIFQSLFESKVSQYWLIKQIKAEERINR